MAITLHWVMVLGILALAALGLVMVHVGTWGSGAGSRSKLCAGS